jgi:AcrR family transcriptional regulator
MTKVTQAHVDSRRASICDAAQGVFARKGVQNATMAEIAQLAGLSAGAIYRYYASKEALAAECMGRSAENVLSEWRRIGMEIEDPRVAFAAMARGSFDELHEPDADEHTFVAVENYLAAARAGDSPYRDAVVAEHDLIVDGLRSGLARMQANGQFPAEIDALHIASALMSFYWGVRLLKLVKPDLDAEEQFEHVWKLIMLASGAHPHEVPLNGAPPAAVPA